MKSKTDGGKAVERAMEEVAEQMAYTYKELERIGQFHRDALDSRRCMELHKPSKFDKLWDFITKRTVKK